MHTQFTTKVIQLDNDRQRILETGKLAKQASGAAVVRMGETMLLATVVAAQEPTKEIDFLPIHVDYQERFAAVYYY